MKHLIQNIKQTDCNATKIYSWRTLYRSARVCQIFSFFNMSKLCELEFLKYVYPIQNCSKKCLFYNYMKPQLIRHMCKCALTPNMRGPSYLGLTRSISWLLMPWLLTSPGHQQPWYWLYRTCTSFSYLRKDFKYLCQINVEEWHKMQIYVYASLVTTNRIINVYGCCSVTYVFCPSLFVLCWE